ncbi:MAG TPA: DUF427 domain-containing protein [Hyphomicrobiales bacterium]|nr:DUF427 domain-containing protein [Hyphomicrobiales bacterium]
MKIPGPDHPVTVTPSDQHVVVRFDGAVVADTRHALVLKEATYPAVYYVPRGDADMSHFDKTQHHTTCPYKGEASYFSLVEGGRRAENAVWSYETPFPAVGDIREHLAFYPDKVEIEVK